MNLISKSLPLIDGYEKITGRLKFIADQDRMGLLHGKLLFSPHAHARIANIDTSKAEKLCGVVAVFTHLNTPDNLYNSTVWEPGQEAPRDEQMFPEIVNHVGDRVAGVVARTPQIAAAAIELIVVHYEPLPHCATLHELNTDQSDFSTDAFSPVEPVADVTFDYGSAEIDFEHADLIVESVVETPKTHHVAIENHACIAEVQVDGKILIESPCQSVFAVQAVVAEAIGLNPSEVRAVKSPIGGSFGGKAEPILEPLCAYFALQTGQPVKIMYNRQETFTATRSRSKAIGRIQTAVTKYGKIVSRDTDVKIDVGAYCTGGHYLPVSMSQRMRRIYDIPSQKYRGRAYRTNSIPSGAYRGYGSPQIHAISEINLDAVARKIKMDPVHFRLQNILEPYSIDPIMKVSVGNAGLRECLEEGAEKFHWDKKRSQRQHNNRFLRGTGMACATHINGCYPGTPEGSTVSMSVSEDGSVFINCAVHDLGCGSTTVLAQIAAATLGVEMSDIQFEMTDTAQNQFDLGTRASRVTFVTGEAVRVASEALKNHICQIASLELNAPPEEIVIEAGTIRNSNRPNLETTLSKLYTAAKRQGQEIACEVMHSTDTNPSSYAAHFVEVEVDIFTGAVTILSYLATHDLGQAINPQLAAGQIYGGVQMGLGMGLFENIDIDQNSGRVRSDRLSRYHIANAPEMPEVDIHLVEKGEPTGPYGAKAIGEIATIPVAPAIVNAVNDALGISMTNLPLSREKILLALQKQ